VSLLSLHLEAQGLFSCPKVMTSKIEDIEEKREQKSRTAKSLLPKRRQEK
jgi:hypothetical protein